MPNKWIDALKAWNDEKGGPWCVPRKGSPEYEQVMAYSRGTRETRAQQRGREERNRATMTTAIEGLRRVEQETKARNAQRKEAAEREVKRKYDEMSDIDKAQSMLLKEVDEWIVDLDKVSWEDVGNPTFYKKLAKKLRDNVADKSFFRHVVKIKNDGAIQPSDIIGLFEGDEAYYRSDGDYGGKEYKKITINQLSGFVMLSAIRDYFAKDMNEEWDTYEPELVYYAFDSDIDDAFKQLEDSNILYDYCVRMPKNVDEALAKVMLRDLDFGGNAADLQEAMRENEDFEVYYPDSFLRNEDIDVTMKLSFDVPKQKKESTAPAPAPAGANIKGTKDELIARIKAWASAKGKRVTNLSKQTKDKLIEFIQKHNIN